MPNDLQNILLVNGEKYNINAVQADKVAQKLTITAAPITTGGAARQVVNFDGEARASLEVVPADGGKFTGPIRVQNADVEKDGISNIDPITGDFVDDAVLNYSDIKNKIITSLLSSSVLYTYAVDEQGIETFSPQIGSALTGISLVAGNETDVDTFATYNKNLEPNLAAYLYICLDTGNIYFGTAGADRAVRLAYSAAQLVGPHNGHTITYTLTDLISKIVRLDSDTHDILYGPSKVYSARQADEAEEAKCLVSIQHSYDADSLYNELQELLSSITITYDGMCMILDGLAQVGNAKIAETATNANKVRVSYKPTAASATTTKYANITISPNAPTSAVDGDIWIKI